MNPPVAGQARLDAYLADLAGRLPGPRRRRERILVELSDGLHHAVADHAAAGLGDQPAVDAAIAGFGSPQAVAEAFTDELITAYARRVLVWYLVTGPLVGLCWLLALRPDRVDPAVLLAAVPVLPAVALAVVTAVSALATTGRLTRWLPEAGPARVLAVTIALAGVVLLMDTTLIALHARLPLQPWVALAVVASLARAGASVVVLRRALVVRRIVTR
jgi:hypothetical protein